MSSLSREFFEHPLFESGKTYLCTPAIQSLRDNVNRWLWSGATGGLIAGPARTGKTTALTHLGPLLRTRANVAVPTVYVSIPKRDTRTITTVFRLLCSSVHIYHTAHDRSDYLAGRFTHYILDQIEKHHCQQAVLLVDEAQRLAPTQFDAFAEVYDTLRMLGMTLTTIFVGNDPELKELVEGMGQSRHAHIHGRFFTRRLNFSGLACEEDVKACLEQYDNMRHPANGPTYTEYFLPAEAKDGWKLSSLSKDIWRIFHEYQREYQLQSWGMYYFTEAIVMLLCDSLRAHGASSFDDEMMKACIEESGMIPSIVRVV